MWNWVAALEKHRLAAQPLVLVTLTESKGSVPSVRGAKMIVLPDGKIQGTIGGGRLEQLAIADALESLKKGETRTVRYPLGAKTGQCCGGSVDLFFEVLNNGPRLYLFGAGHVGQALCRTLVGTPFSVHVIDEREEWAMAEGLPEEVIRFCGDWDDFIEDAHWDSERVYAAIMTHRHDLDQRILEKLLEKKTTFLGLIGSDSKWRNFRERLIARGVSEAALERVHCPIGRKTPGKAPQEIAVGIASELLRVHYDA